MMPTDPLSEALEPLCLHAMSLPPASFTAPWGLVLPPLSEPPPGMQPPSMSDGHVKPKLPRGALLAVREGECRVETEGRPPITLATGDVLFNLRGQGTIIRDSDATPAVPIWEVLPPPPRGVPPPPICFGGGGRATRLCLGIFFTEAGFSDRFFDALPEVIHLRAASVRPAGWLEQSVSLLDASHAIEDAGMRAVRSRMINVLFLQAVRSFVQSLAGQRDNWLRAFLDPDIGQTVALMNMRLAESWTVGSLADAVAMSRSAFAARFSELVGVPPLQYLTELRMNRACELLADPACSVKMIAQLVGYESVAAFSNAFKRDRGVAPAVWRQAASASVPINFRSDA